MNAQVYQPLPTPRSRQHENVQRVMVLSTPTLKFMPLKVMRVSIVVYAVTNYSLFYIVDSVLTW